MRRMREHVDWCHFDEAVATVCEVTHIARLRRDVTRHVDDPLRTHLDHRLEERLGTAFPRWVDDDDVRVDAIFLPLWQHIFRRTTRVRHVIDLIDERVLFRVLDRFRYDFDAVHVRRFPREKQTDRPDAAIGVDDLLGLGQLRILKRLAVKFFRLDRVDLEERVRGNRERQAADLVLDCLMTVQEFVRRS